MKLPLLKRSAPSAAGEPSAAKKKRPSLKKLLALAAAAALVIGLGGRTLLGGGAQAAKTGDGGYTTAQVTRRDVTAAITGSGTLEAADSYNVTTLLEDTILTANFEEGDQVEEGTVLYTLDSSDADSSLEQSEISLQQAQRSYSSQLEDQADLNVAATAAGQVWSVDVEVGDEIQAGQTVATIRDSATMELKVPFPADDAAGFSLGQSAAVTLDSTFETLSGTITKVNGNTEVRSGNVQVRTVTIAVTNPGGLSTDQSATAAVVSADTKGPYVADNGGGLTLPFTPTAVYVDGALSGQSQVKQYDVYYYNAALRTVWVYTDRATGTLTDLSPSKTAPTSATVAGVTYSIGSSTASYKLSSQGQFSQGDVVTVLLGMDGDIVDVVSAQNSETTYYGVVIASTKAASSSSTSSSSTTSAQAQTQVACSDGTVRTFYHSGGAQSVGKLVSVAVTQSGTTLSAIPRRSLSGTVNSAGTRFAGYSFADNVEILDTDGDGGYARIYPSRLAGYSLTDDDVLFYSLDSTGSIDCLILDEATGDTYTYAFVTQATSKTDGSSLSGSYTYLQNGQSHSVSGQQTYSVKVGGARLTFSDNGSLKGMRQLSSVNLTGLTSLTATAGSSKYALAEDVTVLLRDGSQQGYYPTTLSAVNSTDYSLVGWYDNQGASAGGRIRILVATKK